MVKIATRRERVILELEDNFTTKMARAAASAAALDKSLAGLSGSAVRSRGVDRVATDLERVGTSSRRAGADIDRFSGRLGLLRDVALTIGPAFVPIGAVAVPALAGLAAQFGAAALAGGTMLAAFQGVGDALTAVNDAALEPTSENLEAAQIAMENLSPAAQELVRQIQAMRPALSELRDAAGEGLFPGIQSALEDFEVVLPNVERLLEGVGSAAGELAAEFGDGLAGPRGREFLDFLAREMPRAVTELGQTVGNLAAGMGELWMAFTPLNQDFSGWLLSAARDFDRWASGLSETQGFQEFVDYIRTNGPRVADAMGSIGNALLQVVQAAAPLGGPVLQALSAVADAIAVVANSPAGPALFALAAGMAAVSRAGRAMEAIRASTLFAGIGVDADGAARSMSRMQKAAVGAGAGLGALALASSAIREIQEATDDALPGVEELAASLLNVSSEPIQGFDDISESLKRIFDPGLSKSISDTLQTPFEGLFGEAGSLRDAREDIDLLDQALTSLVNTQGPERAAQALREFGEYNQLSAEQMQQLVSQLPGYRNALAAVGNAGREAGDESADGFTRATTAAQRFRTAIEAVNRVLEGRSSVRDYEQALDDLTRSVRENGRSLDITTQKGRENQAALDNIAASAIAVAENLRGSNKIQFLQSARGDMVDAARKLGMTRGEAQALADRLLGLDRMNVKPKIDADTRAALSGIGTVDGRLDSTDKKVANPRVEVDTSGAIGEIQSVESWLNSIQDEVVYMDVIRRTRPGIQRFDTGGYTGPGHRLEPRGIVHAGEVVIPQHLVARDWHMLRARYGHLPGFANGGLVGSQQMSVNTSVAAPNVNVSSGSTSVAVYLDGRQIDARVDTRVAAHARHVERQNDRD